MIDNGILWPEPENHLPSLEYKYIDVHNILATSIKLTGVGRDRYIRSSNLLYNSSPGLGKSLLAATLALELGEMHSDLVPMITFDCSEDTRDHDLRGSSKIMPDGSSMFVLGPLPASIHLANLTGLSVLCIEEISALTPGSQKKFNAMTDWRSGLFIPQIGQTIQLKKGHKVVFVSSMNPSAFGGVHNLNADLRSRLTERPVPFPNKDQEERILRSVCPWARASLVEQATTLARDTRTDTLDYALSTRDLVQLLENIEKLDGDLLEPLVSVLAKFEESDRETVRDRIDGAFNVKVP